MQSKNRAIFAVAGAGKTTKIANMACEHSKTTSKKICMLTYTIKGTETIKEKIAACNDGIQHQHIDVFSWYSFLYHQMVLPYQNDMFPEKPIDGICFEDMYGTVNYGKKGTAARYLTKSNRIRAKYTSEYIFECAKKNTSLSIARLSQIYDEIFIDEIQDLAGWDLNLVEMLFDSPIKITVVGDSRQATFATHNSSKNRNYKGQHIIDYFRALEEEQKISIEYLTLCKRSNDDICRFSNMLFPNLPPATGDFQERSAHDGVFVFLETDLELYLNHVGVAPTMLRYNRSRDTHGYAALNYGDCKGLTFDRVIIFSTGPLEIYLSNFKANGNVTKNYVALTRARYSVAICVKQLPISSCYEKTSHIVFGKELILLRYIST